MNIFVTYKKKIEDLVTANSKIFNIDSKINFDGAVVEIPPQEFNFDLSSNIALMLGKKTKQSPIKVANLIKDLFNKSSNDFSEISIAGPGFINFRFDSKTYQKLILEILQSNNRYGATLKTKKNIILNLYLQIQQDRCT